MAWLWLGAGLVALLALPFAALILGDLWERLFGPPIARAPEPRDPARLPIVWHPGTSFAFMGLHKLHPFDAHKFRRIFEGLAARGIVTPANTYRGYLPSDEELSPIHGVPYLHGLKRARRVAAILETKAVALLPGWVAEYQFAMPQRLASGGSLQAARLALEEGWAINLGGGYHHASGRRGGEGFCIFADVTLVIDMLRGRGVRRVMIIDLDAHQGNGHERDWGDDPDVFIMDAYNEAAYPGDQPARAGISLEIRLKPGTADAVYLARLEQGLEEAFRRFEPQFIIYVAGTDILTGDKLGGLSVSEAGVMERDHMVFAAAHGRGIPILILQAGGYQFSNAPLIARSIENLMRSFKLKGGKTG